MLIEKGMLNKIWILRKFLAEMNPIDAMEFLRDRIRKSKDNKKFLASMKD